MTCCTAQLKKLDWSVAQLVMKKGISPRIRGGLLSSQLYAYDPLVHTTPFVQVYLKEFLNFGKSTIAINNIFLNYPTFQEKMKEKSV